MLWWRTLRWGELKEDLKGHLSKGEKVKITTHPWKEHHRQSSRNTGCALGRSTWCGVMSTMVEFGFHSRSKEEPFRVLEQGSDIISVVIWKSFPTLLAMWRHYVLLAMWIQFSSLPPPEKVNFCLTRFKSLLQTTFLFYLLLAVRVACRHSQARDGTHTIAVTTLSP